MTADSLKAFITLPTTTIYHKKDGHHQRAKLFCFSLFLAAFCATVLCYQIWIFLRTTELRTEVDVLRDKVENMRKRMGLDLFDDLDEFENVYAPHPENGEDVEDSENSIFSDDLNDFDEDIEDEEYDEVYDLDTDLKLRPEDDEIEGGSGLLNTDDIDITGESSSNTNQRKPRAVTAPDLVQIVEESYAVRRNRTNPPTDRLTQLLLKKNVNPKMHYDWASKSNDGKNRDRPPRRHMKTYIEHRGPPTLYVTRPEASSATDGNNRQPQTHIRHNNHHNSQQMRSHQNREVRHKFQEENNSDGNTEQRNSPRNPVSTLVNVRGSRVMRTNEDKTKAFRQTITKREYARLKAQQNPNQFLGARAHPELIAYPPSPKRLVRKSGTGDPNAKLARQVSSRPRLMVAQFNGDTSRYASGHHEHFHGNGLLRHSGGVYTDWSPSHWVSSMGLDKYINMDADGVVTVREPGLYYIYAQIYYKDEHDTNGFVIEHNTNSIMQCSTMTHTTHRISKSNTCHTSGIAFLRADDTLKVADLGHERLVIFEPGKSFFGLIKIANMQQNMHRQQQGQTDPATMSPNFF